MSTNRVRADYRNGWRASQRAERGGFNALESADGRQVSSDWYDGYFDNAAGREFGHLLAPHPAGCYCGNGEKA